MGPMGQCKAQSKPEKLISYDCCVQSLWKARVPHYSGDEA